MELGRIHEHFHLIMFPLATCQIFAKVHDTFFTIHVVSPSPLNPMRIVQIMEQHFLRLDHYVLSPLQAIDK